MTVFASRASSPSGPYKKKTESVSSKPGTGRISVALAPDKSTLVLFAHQRQAGHPAKTAHRRAKQSRNLAYLPKSIISQKNVPRRGKKVFIASIKLAKGT